MGTIVDTLIRVAKKRRTVPFYVLIRKDENGVPFIEGYALSLSEGNKYCEHNNIRERFIKLYVTPFYKSYLITNNRRLKCTTE